MDSLALAVGLMSLALGGFSIWLSFQFYTKAKDAEVSAAKSLEGIKSQTDTLQRLAGKWIDRLTKYVTEPKPADEGMMTLVAAVADLPTTILSQVQLNSPTSTDFQANSPLVIQDLVSCYIAVYWYAAMSNVATQALLPSKDEFDLANDSHVLVQRLIDGSAQDYAHMADVLNGLDPQLLQGSPLKHLLDDAVDVYSPHVATSAEKFAAADADDEDD